MAAHVIAGAGHGLGLRTQLLTWSAMHQVRLLAKACGGEVLACSESMSDCNGLLYSQKVLHSVCVCVCTSLDAPKGIPHDPSLWPWAGNASKLSLRVDPPNLGRGDNSSPDERSQGLETQSVQTCGRPSWLKLLTPPDCAQPSVSASVSS